MKKLDDLSITQIEKEIKERFGPDWKNAKIKRQDYPFEEWQIQNDLSFSWGIDPEMIWNRNGLIYDNGV